MRRRKDLQEDKPKKRRRAECVGRNCGTTWEHLSTFAKWDPVAFLHPPPLFHKRGICTVSVLTPKAVCSPQALCRSAFVISSCKQLNISGPAEVNYLGACFHFRKICKGLFVLIWIHVDWTILNRFKSLASQKNS
jgi:hypothetical protein